MVVICKLPLVGRSRNRNRNFLAGLSLCQPPGVFLLCTTYYTVYSMYATTHDVPLLAPSSPHRFSVQE